jgi:hypothetical protein
MPTESMPYRLIGCKRPIVGAVTEPALTVDASTAPAARLHLHHVVPSSLIALREVAAINPAISILVEHEAVTVELRGERAAVLVAAARILAVVS